MEFKVSESTATRRRIPLKLVDATDLNTPETGLTISSGEAKISKNGGAEANHAGTFTEVGGGVYSYEFTAGELDTFGFVSLRIEKSGVAAVAVVAQVGAGDPYDAVRGGLTALPDENAGASGGLPLGDGSGQVTVGSIAANAINAAAIATDAITAAKIASNAITSAKVADAALTAAKFTGVFPTNFSTVTVTSGRLAADITMVGSTEIITGVVDLKASAAEIRTAVGLASANLDTQLSTIDGVVDDIKAVTVKLDTALEADGSGGWQYTGLAVENAPSGSGLDAEDVRAAIGMAAANLDDQLDGLSTFDPNTDFVQVGAYDSGSGPEELLAATIAEVAAIKAKTDQIALSGGDVVATLAGEEVTPVAAAVRAAIGLAAADLDDQIGGISGGGLGGGDTPYTLTINTTLGDPIGDARVWIRATASDSGTILADDRTDDAGQVTFNLDDGVTYYAWISADGYNFDNPQPFTVTA